MESVQLRLDPVPPSARTHQCPVCLKRFDFVSKLRRHQLTHSGLRPHTCYICLKAFRQSAHLKGHLRRHATSREVSLLLSRAIHSQISGGPDLGEEEVWYGEEARNQCEPQNDELNQQTDDGQMADCDGFKDMSHEERFQNSQYSKCSKISSYSENTECSGKHLEEVFTEDKHKPDSLLEKKTETSSRHQCAVCLKCFPVPSKLQRHLLIHSSLRPFCCQFCPKAFRQLTHLRGHLSTHYPQSRPPDHLKTPEWTEEAAELEMKLNGSDVRPEPEDVRSVKSLTPAEDRTRSKVGHECPVCQKCFSAPSKLRRHVLVHTGQRPFQCSLCCRAFRQLSHLKAHHSVHAGGSRQTVLQTPPTTGLRRPVHVNLARKFRAAKQKLKMSAALSSPSPAPRIRIRENIPGTRPVQSSPVQKISRRSAHSCPVCSKHFSAPSKLRRHVLIHTGQRPFSCSTCSQGFRQKSHLKIHKCKGGSRGTYPSSMSEVHQRDPESSRSTESIRAGDGVGTESFISSSGKGDSFDISASIASESTPEDSKDLAPLPRQVISRSPDKANQTKESGNQCTICFKVFDFPSKLSRHLLIHMDIKPFKCSTCSKSFRQLCHLQNHSKIHTVKTNKNLRRSSIPETFSETSSSPREAGELPVAQRPNLYTDDQKTELDDNSSFSHSMNMEEFTPHVASTSLQGEIHKDEDSSSEMKRLANQCIFCLKTFNFPSKLSRHLLVHTGIRPYRCHVCSKSFKQLSHLQNHQWVHSREDNGDLKAMANPQGLMDSGGDTWSDEADLHPESSESLNQGHDGHTVHHQNCCPDSGHDEHKVKSETDLLLVKSVHPALKHDSVPSGSDRTLSTTCVNKQAEKLENTEFKHLHRTGEVHTPADDGTARSPVRNLVDQQEPVESGDPGPHAQMTHLHGFPFCIPEDSFQRSPIIPDSVKLESNHHRKYFRNVKGPNQHLTEPPNDLPICPSCSQCFDSLQELHAHVCPVRCPEQILLKSYQCAVCFKGFEAPSKLKRHYVIHTGQRPYRCNRCDKDYTQSSHLKKHMLSHS